jgi:phage tail-like protein
MMSVVCVLQVLLLLAANPTTVQYHPPSSAHYTIATNGAAMGGFSEVSGLTTDTNSAEYREGNESQPHVKQLTGLHKYTSITLKRGTVSNSGFYDWYKNKSLKDLSLKAIAPSGQPITYHLRNCKPTKYTGPNLTGSGSGEVAIEELVLSCESITLVK